MRIIKERDEAFIQRRKRLREILRAIGQLHLTIHERNGESCARDLDNLERDVNEVLVVNRETAEVKVAE